MVSAHQQSKSASACLRTYDKATAPGQLLAKGEIKDFNLSSFFFPARFIYSEMNGERDHLSINLSILVLYFYISIYILIGRYRYLQTYFFSS